MLTTSSAPWRLASRSHSSPTAHPTPSAISCACSTSSAAFGAVVISGEVGRAKPDASVFTLALDELGGARENVWHVGDSLRTDVAGAQAAGLTAVRLTRRGVHRTDPDPKPDYEIRSLAELAALLPAGLE